MFERIWKKIMRRESYTLWDLPAFLLWLISLVYRIVVRLRQAMPGTSTRVSVPVISVGNITVGGSGKTPLVAFLAKGLTAESIRVGIVSSGYGRRDQAPFLALGNKVQEMNVTLTGDEVMLLAHILPEACFSVHRRKVEAARRLADSGAVDVIIVDDGFQHLQLARDIDLVAYDAALGDRQLKPFPYGMLREPLTALARADIIVVTRAKLAVDIGTIKREVLKISPDVSLYYAAFHSENIIGRDRQLSVSYLNDKSVFLFAGVGNFRALERQVSALSADLDCALELSDHQQYDQPLLERIKRQADDCDSDLILTTLKDWVKIGDFDFGREFYYLDLAIDLEPGAERLLAEIISRLGLAAKES
ncbi:MAG: tetraacyldisaccharide 4'-kinase [candidate division Zixibacteria bacterium]|nr:tetraacyldisaccharide 4'-kinase [candidate division Zixibacteria bacterium]